MSKCRPSLPFLDRTNHADISLTEADWVFLVKNKNLFRKASMYALGSVATNSVTTMDILLTVAPAVARALRDWTLSGGAKPETLAFDYARNFLKSGAVHLYPCPGKPVVGGRKYAPVCAGSCELPEVVEEERVSTDEWTTHGHVRRCFAFLDDRKRDILDRYMGLYHKQQKLDDIAAAHGISKARVGQIVEAALIELRALYGYGGTRPIGPRPPQPWRPRKTPIWQRMSTNKSKKNSYWRKRQNEKVDS